ncbi:MAG: Uma2 family endonuclease [Betaproteobacteria bacterium]|nr:Uma2 family endonuclease [Betaproteobacteria bacterium]
MALPLPQATFDAEAYLAWEATQPERHEYIGGEVFAMTGARDGHNTIALNIAAWLRSALRGGPCRAFVADMKVQVEAANAFFYPDVFVTCDPRDRGPEADLAKRHPVLVVEVLSDSTAGYDRGRKFEFYQQIPTLLEYLLVEADRQHADLFRRNAEGLWVLHPTAAGGTLTLESLGLELPMDTVYEDVEPSGQANIAA